MYAVIFSFLLSAPDGFRFNIDLYGTKEDAERATEKFNKSTTSLLVLAHIKEMYIHARNQPR